MFTSTAHSSGKVIISGEHIVSFGEVALVGSITLGLTVTLTPGEQNPELSYTPYFNHILEIFDRDVQPVSEALSLGVAGDLPVGSGLGSSAALAHATFKALAERYQVILNSEQLFELVQTAEQFAHGAPSGVDASAVVFGGLLEFQRQADGLHRRSLTSKQLPEIPFYLIQSGKPQESTKQMVSWVRVRHQSQPAVQELVRKMGQLTQQIIQAVTTNTLTPSLLQQNQTFLDELGIVGDRAREMIKLIEKNGSVAKVTGAGGRAIGSGMLLVWPSDPTQLETLISQNQWESYPVKLGTS